MTHEAPTNSLTTATHADERTFLGLAARQAAGARTLAGALTARGGLSSPTASFLLLLVVFRSPAVALKATVMNLLSVGAA